jgi:hypothetical protein
VKDPGFAVDLTLRGNIRDYVEVYLGHTKWRDAAGTALRFDGDQQIARAFPLWLRFETASGRNRRVGRGSHRIARMRARQKEAMAPDCVLLDPG